MPVSTLMLCLTCGYDLAATESDRCPECGRVFDRTRPSTYRTWRRGPQGLIGLGFSIAIAAVAVAGFWFTLNLDYADDRHVAMAANLSVGVVAALLAAGLAAWNRSWWGRIPLLLVGALGGWVGLFLGSDMYYRVWQAMPDPPDEAFADTAPFGVLLGGWIPGGLFVAVSFVVCLIAVRAMRSAAERRALASASVTDSDRQS